MKSVDRHLCTIDVYVHGNHLCTYKCICIQVLHAHISIMYMYMYIYMYMYGYVCICMGIYCPHSISFLFHDLQHDADTHKVDIRWRDGCTLGLGVDVH